jgi:hypothetical protein
VDALNKRMPFVFCLALLGLGKSRQSEDIDRRLELRVGI